MAVIGEDLVTVQYQFWELGGTWGLRTEEPGLGLKAPVRPFKRRHRLLYPGYHVRLAASRGGRGSKPSDPVGTGPIDICTCMASNHTVQTGQR